MEARHLEIVAQFNKSLNEGLTLLYETYGKSLYQYPFRNWGMDEDECYDILYKTLETVGKVIGRYEFSTEKHFTNWLFKIHKNNTLQIVRAKKAKEEIIFTTEDWSLETGEIEYEGLDVDKDFFVDRFQETQLYDESNSGSPLFTAMEKALLAIDEIDRDILLLRMNNYSYDDIAHMLGIENNQLKVKFLRAKAKVQKKTIDILKETSNEKR